MKMKSPICSNRYRCITFVVTFVAILSIPCCSPFTYHSTNVSPSSTLLSAKANPNSHGKKKGRRFSQTVFKQQQPQGSTPIRTSSATSHSSQSQQSDRQWRSSKSIESLEERLMNRWGTDLSPWTAQDVDDDDDEDNVEILGEVPVFQARPVLDPWGETTPSKKPKQRSTLLSSQQREDPMLQRVKKNQQKIRKQREYQQDYDDDDGVEDWPNYDDDDDDANEFNSNRESSNSRIKVDHLIASKPAGGRGTNLPLNTPTTTSSFFFQSSAVPPAKDEIVKNDEASSTTTGTLSSTTRPKPQPRRETIPLLDLESGTPMLLTLEQAERNFNNLLAKEKVKPDDNYDENEEETVDVDAEDASVTSTKRTWQDLGITSAVLLQNLQDMECRQPLPVQEKTCPAIFQGTDVLVGTYTGSGKTLAFLTPMAQQLLSAEKDLDSTVQAIIVAPGRELASQIVSVARSLLQNTGISVMLAIGGTTFTRNVDQIRKSKPTILVGTPGRIAELIVGRPGERSGRIKSSNLRFLVLDEFDALLEYKPHQEPTRAIVEFLTQRRGDSLQSILCSATASDMLGSAKLDGCLRPGFQIASADESDVLVTSAKSKQDKVTRVSRTVIHGVVHVGHKRYALDALRRILHTEPIPQQILIFVESSRKVDIVVEKLAEMGIIAASLHGGRGSEKMDRAEVSKALREGYVGIVVATELAARGLDAPLLTHVINLDLPTDASHYAHRAGRCGRGGRPGVVINITTNPKERNVPKRFTDQLGVPLYTVETRNARLNVIEPSSLDFDAL